MPNSFEETVIAMSRDGFGKTGVWHAQATFIKGAEISAVILEKLPDAQQVSRVRQEIREHGIDGYVVCYLAGKKGSAKLEAKGVRIHDHVIPAPGVGTAAQDDASFADEVMFFFSAFGDGRHKAYALDVIGPGRLGEIRDVTDLYESPFADLFPRKPKREIDPPLH